MNPQGKERTQFHKLSSEPTSCPSSLAQKHQPTVITVFSNLLSKQRPLLSDTTYPPTCSLSFGSKKQYQEASSFQPRPLPYSYSHVSSHYTHVLCGWEDLPFPHPACLSAMHGCHTAFHSHFNSPVYASNLRSANEAALKAAIGLPHFPSPQTSTATVLLYPLIVSFNPRLFSPSSSPSGELIKCYLCFQKQKIYNQCFPCRTSIH